MTRILTLCALMLAASWYIPRAVVQVLETNSLRPPAMKPTASVVERIVLAAADAGLPPRLAVLQFWHESRWQHTEQINTCSLSDVASISLPCRTVEVILMSKGNCGISQLNSRYTPRACSMTEEESIHEGVRQLAGYWSEFGSERLALIAYTAGPSVARRMR